MSRRPTSPDEFASPSGAPACADSRSSRAVPMPFAAHSTTSAGWKCSCPFASSQVAPRARPLPSTSIRRTRAPVTQLHTGGDGPRPVRDVGRTLRAFVAARPARPALHARVAAVVLGRQDRVVLGPPVPAEARVCARASASPARPIGNGGQRRVGAGWVHRVATEPGDPELPVGLLVVGRELLVREGPVVGDAVLGAGAEVGRQQARPHRAVEHGAAADAVEVAEHQVGVVEVDGVVGRPTAHVRRRRPLLAGLELPVGPGAGIAGRDPASRPAPGTPRAGRRARAATRPRPGRAGADDQDVGSPVMRTLTVRSGRRAARRAPAS